MRAATNTERNLGGSAFDKGKWALVGSNREVRRCKKRLRKSSATVGSGSSTLTMAGSFFHRSSLQRLDFDNLMEGEKVEFDVEPGEKGPRVTKVRASAA